MVFSWPQASISVTLLFYPVCIEPGHLHDPSFYTDEYGISSIAVAMNSRDRYEIIRLRKVLHSIKQPCSSVCQ